MKNSVITIIVLLASFVNGAQLQKRNRGENHLYTQSANTTGHFNIWATGSVIGFLWDNPVGNAGPRPFPFADAGLQVGLYDFAELSVVSRPVSYFWEGKPQIGYVAPGLKLTWPNNDDLRWWGIAALYRFRYQSNASFPSLGGYRIEGTGFSPEGFVVSGGADEVKLLLDFDAMALWSKIPIKVSLNTGYRRYRKADYNTYSPLLFSVAMQYTAVGFDMFAEIATEQFITNDNQAKQFYMQISGTVKHFEVYPLENPIHLNLGTRVKYTNGASLLFSFPLLLSKNVGSTMETLSMSRRLEQFPEEVQRGITDGFDPFYAKWKVVFQLSYPLRYKQTSSELRRQFLLKKNVKENKKIDIEKSVLQAQETEQQNAEDRKKRLEEIKKRREQFIK